MHQQSHEPHAPQRRSAPLRGAVRRAVGTAKLLTGVLVLLVLVMPTTAGRMSLASSTYLCTGYQGCEAAGYGNGGYRQASSTMYWRMFAGHNCTNYVAYRLIQSGMPDVRPWEGSGNASNWGVAMAAITDQVPTVGSIAWYKPNVTPAGSAGHVAYVEQVISETEIVVSEDYWGGDFYWRRITKTGGGWPSGFIHFNDRVVQPTSPPTIAGSPMVGAPLEVAAGAWTPAPTSITYRWLADGAAIPGATGAELRAHARRQGQGPDRRGDRPAERLHPGRGGARHRPRRTRDLPEGAGADDPGRPGGRHDPLAHPDGVGAAAHQGQDPVVRRRCPPGRSDRGDR